MKTIKSVTVKEKTVALKLNENGMYVLTREVNEKPIETISSKDKMMISTLFDVYATREFAV